MTLCPGFVKTEFHERMGVRRGSGFMWLEADFLVREALADFDRGRVFSVPGAQYKAIRAVTSVVPTRAAAALPVDGPPVGASPPGATGVELPMRPRLPALLALALAATLVATPSAGSEPIPDSPGAENVAPYLGKPATARPLADQSFAPRHPWMAGNGRSNLHDDAYQSDAGTTPGPLGRDPEVLSNFFAQECASHTFDREGRLLTVCVGVEQVTLRLLDPDTLDVLAELPLPPRQPSTSPFTTFGGGGYFYLDHRDRVVVPTSAGTIDVIRDRRHGRSTGPGDGPQLRRLRPGRRGTHPVGAARTGTAGSGSSPTRGSSVSSTAAAAAPARWT